MMAEVHVFDMFYDVLDDCYNKIPPDTFDLLHLSANLLSYFYAILVLVKQYIFQIHS